jgi:hypothetical protein
LITTVVMAEGRHDSRLLQLPDGVLHWVGQLVRNKNAMRQACRALKAAVDDTVTAARGSGANFRRFGR